MRSETPEAAAPVVRPADDRLAGGRGARGRRRRRWSSSTTRSAGSRACSTATSRSRFRSSREAPPTRSGPEPRGIAAGRTVVVLNGDVPLITAETIRALAETPRALGSGGDDRDRRARRPDRLRPRGPGARRDRRARRRDQGARRRHRARAPHPRGQHRRVRVRRRRAAGRARPRSAATTPRASCTSPTCCRCSASTSERVGAYEISDHEQMLGINDRVALAQVAALAQRRIQERLMLAGRDDRQPGRDHDRRRRGDRPGHGDRPVHAACTARPRSARGRRSARSAR